jgi:hypothetical protein
MSRSKRSRSHFTSGGPDTDTEHPIPGVPLLDKDPFYRTNEIFNNLFKKNFRIEQGPNNATDCAKKIFVNFGERLEQVITGIIDAPIAETTHTYSLACGHEWRGKPGAVVNGVNPAPCLLCSAQQIYRGFEHEWQHIIFKSNLVARKIFCEQFARMLFISNRIPPHLNEQKIVEFLSILVNAFDDIRCNSLWSLVYPGSSDEIWKRWRRLTEEKTSNDFITFVFQTHFDLPSDPKWDQLRAIVKWGTEKVQYRGFANMLLDLRVVVEQCLAALVQQQEQPQPPPPPSAGGPSPPGPLEAQLRTPDTTPNVKGLDKLVQGAEELDENETHADPSPDDMKSPGAQVARAMVARALQPEKLDPQEVDALLSGPPDQDVRDAVDQLRDGISQKSMASMLISDTKAKTLLIDVKPEDVEGSAIELTPEELLVVQRMRSSFFKALGRRKAKRGPTGPVVDVPAFVQYLCGGADPNVFESEDTQRGFAYAVLSDMSGSMDTAYVEVCHGMELLKKSLDFPFVMGSQWGFRGATAVTGNNFVRKADPGEVWIYRYDKDCNGHKGVSTVRNPFNGLPLNVPVECGGLTPMAPAIHVATTHLRSYVSSGMAKCLFLLTDGSPYQQKTSGGTIPESMLRAFVAKEIQRARASGIKVFTLVIGEESIPEDKCLQMFGPKRFWRRTSEEGLAVALSRLVIENFTTYLTRG